MDDIARELGMSKKTIYQHVSNKADLVYLTLESYLKEDREQLENILTQSSNSIDAMVQMAAYILNQLRDFNPYVLHDLQKYYPDSWKKLHDYRYTYFRKRILENLLEGIEQGIYRDDIHAEIISKIYIKGFENLTDQELFPSKTYAFIELYKQFLQYHLHGILTKKGLQLLEKSNLFQKA